MSHLKRLHTRLWLQSAPRALHLAAILFVATVLACESDHPSATQGLDAQIGSGQDAATISLDGGADVLFDATLKSTADAGDVALADSTVVIAKNAPNIVFVLVDDFSLNLVDAMPQLKRMMADGLTFSNYFVSDSLCCPSRTSMFTGKFPHNSGVFTNGGDDGGYATFNKRGNDKMTFATALQRRGYTTAMLGKYLNGYLPTMDGPQQGWTHWNVAGNGYPEFDYDLNQDGTVVHYGKTDQDYLTNVIARLGTDIIKAAATGPFVIEFATFAPHAPYTPAPQDANLFPDSKLPRTPAFGARPDARAPAWLQLVPQLTQAEIDTLEGIYRKRMQAVQAVDRMIAGLRSTLDTLGLSDNTYLVFTSDNGYHLGDFSLRAGKQTAYDTDIHVPLIVVGPGVPKGKTVDAIVQNIDLCPTFRELSGAGDASAINGRSLVPFLRGNAPMNWRTAALVEHHGGNNDPTDPDGQDKFSADPPSYAALRLASELYVEYADGGVEYHDLSSDAYELNNTEATLPATRKSALHDALGAVTSCKTAADCWAAQHVP